MQSSLCAALPPLALCPANAGHCGLPRQPPSLPYPRKTLGLCPVPPLSAASWILFPGSNLGPHGARLCWFLFFRGLLTSTPSNPVSGIHCFMYFDQSFSCLGLLGRCIRNGACHVKNQKKSISDRGNSI